MHSRKAYIGLGSNLGDRERLLGRAVRSLIDVHHDPKKRIPLLRNLRLSPIYETAPVGVTDQPDFLNAVVEGDTEHSPEDLLAALKHIEGELGRTEGPRWGPRAIDLDILDMSGTVRGGDPTLPHLSLHERAFVLRPLADLAPDLVHPVSGVSVRGMLAVCDTSSVRQADRQWGAHEADDTASLIPSVAYARMLTPNFLGDALHACGAVRVEHAFMPHLSEGFLRAAGHAFALPADVKQRSRRVGGRPGFTPPGVERVTGHGPDLLRHFWDVWPGTHTTEKEVRAFYEAATRMWTWLGELALGALGLLDRAYGTSLQSGAVGGDHMLRTSQYLNNRVSALDVLFPSHYDFGLFTLYLGGPSAGLQVKINGAWHDVFNPPGSVIFGLGTTFGLYAPGTLRPLRHRVVGGSLERISSVYFTELGRDVIMPNGVAWGDRLARLMGQVREE